METSRLAAVAAGLACLATSAAAQDYPFHWTAAGTVTPVPPAPVFLMLAGASDLYEIESSRLVMESTADAEVRAFARMMVDHHTKTTSDVAAAARRAGLEPSPPMLAAPQAAMLEALRGYQGAERDRLYLAQQMMAHKEALGVMRTYAEGGETAELKTAARATVPIIQRHIAEVERLSRR